MTRERLELTIWGLGLIGLFGSIAGWVVAPAAFAPAWLAALLILLAWTVGSMALLFVHGMTGGVWGALSRMPLLAGALSSVLLLPCIIPVLLLVPSLYGWAHSAEAQKLGNTRYLNPAFFWGRVGGAVLLWVLLGLFVVLIARRSRISAWISGPALAALMLSVTWVGVDTILSREPHFNSTAFGMVLAAEWALFALAAAVFTVSAGALAPSAALNQLGRLLLVLLVLWGYLVFVQFLIVWNSDLAVDAPWYVARAEAGWGIVSYLIAVLHFAVPLLVLISPRLRAAPGGLMVAAGAILLSEIPRAWWLVLPSSGAQVGWIAGLTMLMMLGLCAALALRLPALLIRWGAHHA